MPMSPHPTEIIANVNARQKLQEPAIRHRDFLRTYLTLGGYLIASFLVTERLSAKEQIFMNALFLSYAVFAVIRDTQRAANRRFEEIAAYLERAKSE